MTDLIAPLPKLRFCDNNGNPLSGGKLFTYAAGTTTKLTSYTDSSGGTANANPIILDSRGECNCWLSPINSYKFVLSPSTDTDPPTNAIWTVDNVPAGLSGYTITANPSITVSPTGNPTGGSVPATLASLNIQANTTSSSYREFLLCVGLTSAAGQGGATFNDKVAGYFGIVGNNGSSNIWSLNTVCNVSSGAFAAGWFDAQGYELDFNNLCQDMGNPTAGSGFAPPVSVGLAIAGGGYKCTTAVEISGLGGVWNRGISFVNNCVVQAAIQDLCSSTVSYQMYGNHTIGIDMSNSSCTYATVINDGNGHYAFVSSAYRPLLRSNSNNMLLGDTSWTNVTSYNTILPTGTLNLGSSGAPWATVYAGAFTTVSNPILKTDITDAPSFIDVATSLPIKTFRWRKGGVDTVETMEDQTVHATHVTTWTSQQTKLDEQGIARLVTTTHSAEELAYDDVPVLDANGTPVMEKVPAKPAVVDAQGNVVQPAQEAGEYPRMHRVPRMVTKPVPVKRDVDRPGKRLHLGALAPDIKEAFAKTGMDFAAYKEEGDFQGYQLDQIVWLTLKALQEEIAARKALEERLK